MSDATDPTHNPKREALQHALLRFHEHEEEALGELRRTALDAARKPRGKNDMGPEIRVQAVRQTLEDIHTLAASILLPLHSIADAKLRLRGAKPPSPDVVPYWNERAQRSAEHILRQHLSAALVEIHEAASFRMRIGDEAHAVIYNGGANLTGKLPRAGAAKAIAAITLASPEGAQISLPALAEFAGKAISNLTWEMVRPGPPVEDGEGDDDKGDDDEGGD